MPKEKLRIIAVFALFVIITILVHKDVLKTPLFWDDEATILDNVFIRDIRFVKQIFTSGYHGGWGEISNLYRPLVNLNFLVEYRLFKTNSLGYHATNLGLHIINAFLVFFILYSFFKKKTPAFLSALLFLIHPVVTEVINYASHRPELLMTLFLLAGFLSYMRFLEKDRGYLLVLSSLFFILSIFCKEMGLVFIVFLLLYHRLRHNKKYSGLIPFLAITLIYIIIRATLLNFLGINILTQGAQADPYSENVLERILIFSKSFFIYLKILFMPVGLHMDRDTPLLKSAFELNALLKSFLIIAIVAVIIKSRHRPISFWAGWFMAGLIPVSGIIPINTAIAEHYLYMPSIGFFAVAGYFFFWLYTRAKTKRLKAFLIAAGAILYIILGFLSSARNKEWNDPLTLYLSTIKNARRSFRCNNNAGVEYFRRGSVQTAEYYFKQSLEILPTYAPAINNMGVIAQKKGQVAKAIELYKKAIEYERDYLLAYRNLYGIYFDLGRKEDGRDVLERMLEVFPYDEKAKRLLNKIKAQTSR